MRLATDKQMSYLKTLIKQTGHPMVLPEKISTDMASNRIRHLLKYQKNPKIKPLYLQ